MSKIAKLKFKIACLKDALSFGNPTFYEDYNHNTHSTLMCANERMQTTMEKCLDYKHLIYENEFESEQYRFAWIIWIEHQKFTHTTWSIEAIVAVIEHFIEKKYIKALKKLDKICENNCGTYFDNICIDGYLSKIIYIKVKKLINSELNQTVIDKLEQWETEKVKY
uniref:VHS domain-containing protein n=1 Tax=Pithovirus LCPAC001 TaxID=2506585 RepID=A0A481Z1E1_9VIRU|nr:MAG: hypothetical protein LCPAC001_00560 [Pithovirus LCPAC001]